MALKESSQSGSAIFLLFVCVALFGALSYAVLQGSRTSLSLVEGEEAKADATASADCATTIAMATKRLEARGCGLMISTSPDGLNTNPDAPADGSCSIYHPNGGGAANCSNLAVAVADPDACLATLVNVGDTCNGIVFAGYTNYPTYQRLYTTPADLPGTYTWNNATTSWFIVPGLTASDGLANTNILVSASNVGAPYNAAQACRALGPKWFLPTGNQFGNIDQAVRTDLGLVYGAAASNNYWTSSQYAGLENRQAYQVRFFDNGSGFISSSRTGINKNTARRVRCFRHD